MLDYAAKFEQRLPPAREYDAATNSGPVASAGAIECSTAIAKQVADFGPTSRTLAPGTRSAIRTTQ
jgi:hypothetical protein